MGTAIVLLTRDLRVHDNPALHAAVTGADTVVPLFVVDDGVRATSFNRPNRATFLAESLADLDASLQRRGGGLVVRRGDVVAETATLADRYDATTVHMAADYSRYAVRREARLRDALGRRELQTHHSHVVQPPGDLTPASTGSDHFAVFSPYHRRWQQTRVRSVLPAPDRLSLPEGIDRGRLPAPDDICPGPRSPDLLAGGETNARTRAKEWYDGAVRHYGSTAMGGDDGNNDLGTDGTSRLSAYLHFGCLSPVELVQRGDRRKRGVDPFLRQIAWRDFYMQVMAARPDIRDTDYRSRDDRWRADEREIQAWKDGCTGYPVVDAGMRQLKAQGWMHNRARLVTGSFLTKQLYVDWRVGAQHFFDWLIDGDIANNCMNWQWIAGTGTDTKPERVLNPTLQAQKYDPHRTYVKRWVPEVDTAEYPPPIVDHKDAVRAFRAARAR
jgi:deoxyribodipyrimidine photo-lyase